MPLTALALVLVAAVAHAVWNIVAAKSSGSGVVFLWWGAVVSAALWAIAIPFTGGIGTASLGSFAFGVGVSGLIHLAYMLVLQRGYAKGEVSTVYATARGSGPMLTVLVSIALFGERPGLWALLGVVLVIAGVVSFGLIGRSRSASAVRYQGGSARRGLDPALVYGLLTGVAIAGYTVWDVHVVNSYGVAPVAFMVGTCIAQAFLFGALLLRRPAPLERIRDEFRTNWRRVLVFGVLSPLSYILVLTAATIAPLSLVAPMREVSVVLVGLYGVVVYRENKPVLRIIAALVVVIGVVLLGA